MAVHGYQILYFEWSMVILTFLLVALRLYTRISRSRLYRPLPATSDVFVVLAWLSFTLQAALNSVLHTHGFYNPNINAMKPAAGNHTSVLALKIYFVEQITYLNCVYAVKASMLSLFEEFFPKYMKWTRRWLNITIAFVAVSWVLQALLCTFWCIPINRNWSMDEKYYCSCWNSFAVGVLSLAPHFLSDIIIYILPLPVLFHLTLPRQQKIGLALTFSFGFLCIFFAIAYLVVSMVSSSLALMSIFGILEQTYAIIVSCCPLFRAFCGEGRRLSFSAMRRRGKKEGNGEKKDYEVGVLVVQMRDDEQRVVRGQKVVISSDTDSRGLDRSKATTSSGGEKDGISVG